MRKQKEIICIFYFTFFFFTYLLFVLIVIFFVSKMKIKTQITEKQSQNVLFKLYEECPYCPYVPKKSMLSMLACCEHRGERQTLPLLLCILWNKCKRFWLGMRSLFSLLTTMSRNAVVVWYLPFKWRLLISKVFLAWHLEKKKNIYILNNK